MSRIDIASVVKNFLLERYPKSDPEWRDGLADVCGYFVASGLAEPKFANDVSSRCDQRFWSCVSEALLAWQLYLAGVDLVPTKGRGPDLLAMHEGRKVWIEVICPEPKGIADGWLGFVLEAKTKVMTFPHDEMILRWTSAIKEKGEKLLGSPDGKVKGYLANGTVGPEDAYVIAVNGCRLRGAGPSLHGISGYPFAAEAVFGIGPYVVHIDRETFEQTWEGHQHRPLLPKPQGAAVPAEIFLDPRFRPISAIWAVDVVGTWAASNPMAVVHNPDALNPVLPGFLPAHEEYVAVPAGEDKRQISKVKGRL